VSSRNSIAAAELHRLSYGFVLGYHGCDRKVGERLLAGDRFKASENDYDWLGPGIYFWEANPQRGIEFAKESAKRSPKNIRKPYVIGAVIDLGHCLDLSTLAGIAMVRSAYTSLRASSDKSGDSLPTNGSRLILRKLDCAVIRRVHSMIDEADEIEPFDTVRGVFTEGEPAYPGAGFLEKTHIQIAVRDPSCIKGVFRVPGDHLKIPDLPPMP
jgi:hypothetical protein